MQNITKSLDALFAKAGRAEAKRRDADTKRKAERQRQEQQDIRRRREAKVMEPIAASRIWAWVNGPDADELRAQLARAGLPEVRLIGPVTHDARSLRVSMYGAWSVWLCVKSAAMRIDRVAPPPGGRSRIVESRKRFATETPTEIIIALDQVIASRRYLRSVRASLREILAPQR